MKYASLDIGLKRIGLAITLDSKIVFPLEAILRTNRNQAARDTKKLLDTWEIEKLVVGLPYDGSSSEEMQRRIQHFVSLLEFDGEVDYQDEQGSSYEAAELTKGQFRHKKDGKIDSMAAKLILERYLKI